MIWLSLFSASADSPNELHASAQADFHHSFARAGYGIGARVGYRRHLGPLTLGGSLGVVALEDLIGTIELEAGGQLRGHRNGWRPWVGLETVGQVGAYRIQSARRPSPHKGPAWSVRAAVRPLAFYLDNLSVSVLEVSYGQGVEAPGASLVAGVTPLTVGIRW
jgi:hypothetical protein